ncbi:MAG: DUF4157 domain-containing protein [Pseudomonadota bacterium]
MGAVPSAKAGGLFGDMVETLCGNCGAGRALDKAHNDIGNPLDVSGRVIKESTVETIGPLLGEAIRHSRNEARRVGTKPMTNSMKFHMSPYFDQDILNRVQYRVGQGGELSVEMNSFRFGDASAVALIDTVIFRSQNSTTNTPLWAHELFHITQFRSWGLSNFGKRYVRSYRTVEADAERMEKRFKSEHPYLLGNQPTHPGGARSEPWVYLGRYGANFGRYDGGWVSRNFTWPQNRKYLPMLGSVLTARRNVNVRANHIQYVASSRSWQNARIVGSAKKGGKFKVIRLRDVTGGQGFMWAMVQPM